MAVQTVQDGFYYRQFARPGQSQEPVQPAALDKSRLEIQPQDVVSPVDSAAPPFTPLTPSSTSHAIFASPAIVTPSYESVSSHAQSNGHARRDGSTAAAAHSAGVAVSSAALRDAAAAASPSATSSSMHASISQPRVTAHKISASRDVLASAGSASVSGPTATSSGSNATGRAASSERAGAVASTSRSVVGSGSGRSSKKRCPRTDEELLQIVVDLRERTSRSQQRQETMNGFRFPPAASSSSAAQAQAAVAAAGSGAGVTQGTQLPERSGSVPRPGSAGSSEMESLDLSSRKIMKLSDTVIELIKDDVSRLALATNRLTTLPASFSNMRRLRYLNIRSNGLVEVPPVLCELPCLEILDLSGNKVKQLPKDPGTLINLRVLAVNMNQLQHLPVWFGRMKNLKTAKLTSNPLQWPPPEVMKPGVDLEAEPDRSKDRSLSPEEKDRIRRADEKAMLGWIGELQAWIVAHAHEAPEDAEKAPLEQRPPTNLNVDPTVAAALASNGDSITSPPRIRRISPKENGKLSSESERDSESLAKRSLSISTALIPVPPIPEDASDQSGNELPYLRRTSNDQGESGSSRPGTSDRPGTGDASVATSASHYRPTLAVSNGHNRDGSTTSISSFGSRSHMSRGGSTSSAVVKAGEERPGLLAANKIVPPWVHHRNNSHSIGQTTAKDAQKGKVILKGKKSLPDLRQNHGELLHDRNHLSAAVSATLAGRLGHGRMGSASSIVGGEGMTATGGDGMILPKRPGNATRRPPLPQSITYSPGQTSTSLSSSTSMPRRPSLAATAPASPADDYQSSPTSVYRNSPLTYGSREQQPNQAPSGSGRRRLILAGPHNDVKNRRDVTDPLSPSAQAEAERNSYFRRLSMLPPSTINKAVPQAVLHVIDSTRGVLYALSQIHSALKQYILFAVVPATTASGMSTDDGRVSAPFNRVLDIASVSMAHFIDALDRFDSMSRRGTPPASVVRDVFMACKDSVQIFRKVTGVLQLQLRALLNTADVRYTRTLLLMLYGSIAEVSNSYRTMAPQIEAIMPYLSGASIPENLVANGFFGASASLSSMTSTKPSRTLPGSLGHTAAGSTFSTPSLPSIAEQTSPGKPRPVTNVSRLARNRHAGNFSARDVEQGAMIAPAPQASSGSSSTVFKSGAAAGSMEQLIKEEKQRLEAAANGEDAYGPLPLPPLPLSEISVHLNNSGRSRSGSGTGSENGQLLSASSSTGSGVFDTVSSSGGLVSGGLRRQGPPSGLGALPTSIPYNDDLTAGFPRSPGGRPILLASGSGFGPRRGEGMAHSHVAQDSVTSEGRRGYFDHAHSRSMPSRPIRRGRTGSSASIGSAGAQSTGGPGASGWAGSGQPPLPSHRPNTAGNPTATGAMTPRTAGSASGRRERERPPVADDHLLMLTDQLTLTASAVWTSLDGYLEQAAQQQEQNEQQQSQQDASGGGNAPTLNGSMPSRLLSRRMRDLNAQLSSASTLTEQLRTTLETIRASLDGDAGGVPDSGMSTLTSTNVIKQPAAEIQKLWEDGNVLIRTVVQVSTFIKGITTEHNFPPGLLLSLGELTSVCSQVMVHMHFLQPGKTGAPPASSARSVSAAVAGGGFGPGAA
ncbi:RAM signaling network component [Tilletia horrida]|nr:RAM signaling network component [Tilletia horrida]